MVVHTRTGDINQITLMTEEEIKTLGPRDTKKIVEEDQDRDSLDNQRIRGISRIEMREVLDMRIEAILFTKVTKTTVWVIINMVKIREHTECQITTGKRTGYTVTTIIVLMSRLTSSNPISKICRLTTISSERFRTFLIRILSEIVIDEEVLVVRILRVSIKRIVSSILRTRGQVVILVSSDYSS